MPTNLFNLSPAPTTGQGAFGAVPGQLGLPNPAGDLAAQLPGLPQMNEAASGDVLAKLGGTLSPGTLHALQNAQATFGVNSGMPGSGLSWNSLYGNIAGAAENQQQQGLQDYGNLTGAVSSTQTVNPALQNEIATQNSLNGAAPDPTKAASYAEQLYNKYLNSMGGGGGHVSNLPGNLLQPGGFAGMFGGTPAPATPAAPVSSASDGGYGASYSQPWTDPGGYDYNSGENYNATPSGWDSSLFDESAYG